MKRSSLSTIRWAVLLAVVSIMVLAVDFLPEGNEPKPGDGPTRSAQKITGLLYAAAPSSLDFFPESTEPKSGDDLRRSLIKINALLYNSLEIGGGVLGSGGSATYVNGTSVTNANFKTGSTATITVSFVTNITVNPTNIANAQIASGAAIDFSKLSGVAPAFVASTLTYGASITLNLSTNADKWLVLAGNTTISTTGVASNVLTTIRIDGDSSDRTVILPSGWHFMSGAITNTLLATKIAHLVVKSYGIVDTNILASWISE